MITPVARLLDDSGSILWDFHDTDGSSNPYTVRTTLRSVDKGILSPEDTFFDSAREGSRLARRRQRRAEMGLMFRADASTHEDLRSGIGQLQYVLESGPQRLLLQEAGSIQEARYTETIALAELAPLLRGQDIGEQNRVIEYASDLEYEARIWRQPWWEGAELDPTANKLLNATLLLDQSGTANRPDDWTWADATDISNEFIEAEAYQFNIATTAVRVFRQDTAAATAAPGEVWTVSVYAKVSAGTSARVNARLVFLDNTGAPIGGGTFDGTQVTLDSTWRRLSVTATAPALTDRVRANARFLNTDATSNRVHLRYAQAEKASSASLFRAGSETVQNNVTSSRGRAIPIYIHGDAPAPVKIRYGFTADTFRVLIGWADAAQKTAYLNGVKYVDLSGTVDANAAGGQAALSNPTITGTEADIFSPTLTTPHAALTGGPWRIAARVRGTGASASDAFRLRAFLSRGGSWSTSDFGEYVTFSPGTDTTYVDILFPGQYEVPVTPGTLRALIRGYRTAGTGDVLVDFVAIVPAEELADLKPKSSSSDNYLLTDPEGGTVWQYDSSNLVINEGRITVTGAVPATLPPGLNILYISPRAFADTGGHPQSILGAAPSVRVLYSPRYRQ